MDEENENRFNYVIRGRGKVELNDSLESEIKVLINNEVTFSSQFW